jgi:hypothetical protein
LRTTEQITRDRWLNQLAKLAVPESVERLARLHTPSELRPGSRTYLMAIGCECFRAMNHASETTGSELTDDEAHVFCYVMQNEVRRGLKEMFDRDEQGNTCNG